MAGELNSVQESIKLALDAADAATDVTSEYSQVKREHKKLESKVSQIHRYTTITFVSAISAAVIALAFSATLYFKSISELKLMTTTNREGLIVFSENIEKLNTVLAELQVSLSKQEELVKLNRESTSQIAELKKTMADGSASIVAQLQKTGDGMNSATIALGDDLKTAMVAQNNLSISGFPDKLKEPAGPDGPAGPCNPGTVTLITFGLSKIAIILTPRNSWCYCSYPFHYSCT